QGSLIQALAAPEDPRNRSLAAPRPGMQHVTTSQNRQIGEGLHMPVRTTVVGSWWLHPEMEKDLARHHAGELSPKESEAVLNRAAAKAIAEQRALGFDEWSGGEYHTDNFMLHMHKWL